MTGIFLGRTEEQERFRQVLRTFQPGWMQRYLPTVAKLSGSAPEPSPLPFVLLFYGEGGMGKTTLVDRLCQIVKADAALQAQFQLLFLDWESQQKQTLDLQVGHDHIRPETLLQVLHKAIVEAGWGSHFENYRKLVQEIKAIEAKVEKELRSPSAIDLPKEMTNLGAKGIAWMIHRSSSIDIPSDRIAKAINISAEGLHQTREFVQKALTPKEFDTYAQLQERLAEALGKGLAELAKRQPVVVALDTFEIVDRPECDYTLRKVMEFGGRRVVWVIAGRANLADSGRRGDEYFRGYKAEFPDDRLYAKALSEFSVSDIQAYFQSIVPDRPLTKAQATALAQFSLGIPFVVSEAAVMWRDGVALETLVAPVAVQLGQTTAHQAVINSTSERFLVHCFGAKERERDLQAVYALAMMRRPDVELLKAMLDCDDLDQTLRSLRERYSFIWVEEVRLAEKLASFIRDYLLAEVRRTSPGVQQISDRAIAWLELDIEARTRPLTDTADWFESDRLAAGMITLAYFQFWKSEEAGWGYLLPRFVEGWQYDRSWTRKLLEAVALFQPHWSQAGQRRFDRLSQGLSGSADPEDTQCLLTDLDKPTQRQGLDGPGAAERHTILRFKKGQLLQTQANYTQALQVYLDVKNQLTSTTTRLRTDLAEALYTLSSRFIWAKGNQYAAYSRDGEQAIEAAVALNADPTGSHHYNLGVVKNDAGKYEQAIGAYHRAIDLDPNDAYPHNGLGNVYDDQGKYEQAIGAYNRAIDLDPNDASPHNGLGIVYRAQGKYEEAIGAYHRAIDLDPNADYAHYVYNNIGEVYLLQNQLDKAEIAFREAIQCGGDKYNRVFSLGLVKALQGERDEATRLWQQSLTLHQGTTIQNRLELIVIKVALKDETLTPAEIEATLKQAESSKGLLQGTLDYAMLLSQCPVQPAQIAGLIAQLRAALDLTTE